MTAVPNIPPVLVSFLDQLFADEEIPDCVLSGRLDVRYEHNCTVHGEKRWRRGELLGSGGFGVVKLERLELDLYARTGPETELRAVKIINLEHALRSTAARRRLIRELEALAVFSGSVVSTVWLTANPRGTRR